ncbi:MAG: TMEM175 family protein [Pseudolabrys sp.]
MLHRATPERLSAFSDGVFAVLITVLVLELRPPEIPTFKAPLELWPTWLSYAVSYLFIAIVWVNHHYLMRYATEANSRLLWSTSRICFQCRCSRSQPPGWRSASWRRSRLPFMRRSSSSSTRLTFV